MRKADVLGSTREYDRRNLARAKEVLSDRDKFPHLVDWANRVIARLEAEKNTASSAHR